MREVIELQSVRSAPMYERLKRAQQEAEQENPGLRDMRNLHRVHQAEETGAMKAIGWLFVFVAGVGLGVCLAAWWAGLL
jgi:hypothetical protein